MKKAIGIAILSTVVSGLVVSDAASAQGIASGYAVHAFHPNVRAAAGLPFKAGSSRRRPSDIASVLTGQPSPLQEEPDSHIRFEVAAAATEANGPRRIQAWFRLFDRAPDLHGAD